MLLLGGAQCLDHVSRKESMSQQEDVLVAIAGLVP
jgi:hypothetical protein